MTGRDPLLFYPTPIELDELGEGRANRRELEPGVEVVVYRHGSELHVFRDVCPHMGAPLSTGGYCKEARTVHCPWHGYVFKADTGCFLRNPNEEIFRSMHGLYASYKPEKRPEYRLGVLAYEIEGVRAWVRRSAMAR